VLSGVGYQGLEVLGIPGGGFSADFEAVLVLCAAQEVHGHVSDGRHVLGTVAGSEAAQVFMEDDIEDPVEPG
jgi:hypothetical protein